MTNPKVELSSILENRSLWVKWNVKTTMYAQMMLEELKKGVRNDKAEG